METKKLYEIIDEIGYFYSNQFGYIKNDGRNNNLNISIDCSIYRMVKTEVYRNRRYDYIEQEERRNCSLDLTSIYKHVVDSRYDRINPKDFLDDKIEAFYASEWDSNRMWVNPNNPFKIEFKSFSINGIPISDIDGFKKGLKSSVYVLPMEHVEEPLYDYEAKVGDYVVSKSPKKNNCKQTFLVKEVYDQPNEGDLLCKLYSEYDGDEFDATCGKAFLWKLPYKEYDERVNELAQFNDEIRERELNPLWEIGSYTMTSGGDYNSHTSSHAMSSGNLYWQKMEEAASYTVSLYKYYPNKDVEKKLFLLEEFEVDRNKHWLTINNLFGNNYIIRIKAEDRSGGILAVSRGIKIKWTNTTNEQKPESWK